MILLSQKDPKWAKQKLGACNDTIAQSGCKITSFGMLAGITPDVVNKTITYTNGCLTIDEKNAKELGLEYLGRTTVKPNYICIAETDHWKKVGVPQHFFIVRPDGMIADPLDYPCNWKKNPYKIVSYRLIKEKEEAMKLDKKFQDELEKYGMENPLTELEEENLPELKEMMSSMRNQRDTIKETLRLSQAENAKILQEKEELKKGIADCYDTKDAYKDERDKCYREYEKLKETLAEKEDVYEDLLKSSMQDPARTLALENSFEGMQRVIRSLKAENENIKLEKSSTLEMASFQELAKAFLNKILK